jgi:hypothetical protein
MYTVQWSHVGHSGRKFNLKAGTPKRWAKHSSSAPFFTFIDRLVKSKAHGFARSRGFSRSRLYILWSTILYDRLSYDRLGASLTVSVHDIKLTKSLGFNMSLHHRRSKSQSSLLHVILRERLFFIELANLNVFPRGSDRPQISKIPEIAYVRSP